MAFFSSGHFLTGSHCTLRPNTEGTPILLAAQEGHVGVVNLLHMHGAKVGVYTTLDGTSLVHRASQNGHGALLSLAANPP
jgi:hypothetical protein